MGGNKKGGGGYGYSVGMDIILIKTALNCKRCTRIWEERQVMCKTVYIVQVCGLKDFVKIGIHSRLFWEIRLRWESMVIVSSVPISYFFAIEALFFLFFFFFFFLGGYYLLQWVHYHANIKEIKKRSIDTFFDIIHFKGMEQYSIMTVRMWKLL